MPPAAVSLPVLPAGHALRLTPTDVSQFVRLEQCERYLRFRLAERAGQKFMEEYGVIATRAARSKRQEGMPAVVGPDGAYVIVPALNVEREPTGIKDALAVNADGMAPEVGVAVLEAVPDSYFLQETYKVAQPGRRNPGGYAMAVLAEPAPVKK